MLNRLSVFHLTRMMLFLFLGVFIIGYPLVNGYSIGDKLFSSTARTMLNNINVYLVYIENGCISLNNSLLNNISSVCDSKIWYTLGNYSGYAIVFDASALKPDNNNVDSNVTRIYYSIVVPSIPPTFINEGFMVPGNCSITPIESVYLIFGKLIVVLSMLNETGNAITRTIILNLFNHAKIPLFIRDIRIYLTDTDFNSFYDTVNAFVNFTVYSELDKYERLMFMLIGDQVHLFKEYIYGDNIGVGNYSLVLSGKFHGGYVSGDLNVSLIVSIGKKCIVLYRKKWAYETLRNIESDNPCMILQINFNNKVYTIASNKTLYLGEIPTGVYNVSLDIVNKGFTISNITLSILCKRNRANTTVYIKRINYIRTGENLSLSFTLNIDEDTNYEILLERKGKVILDTIVYYRTYYLGGVSAEIRNATYVNDTLILYLRILNNCKNDLYGTVTINILNKTINRDFFVPSKSRRGTYLAIEKISKINKRVNYTIKVYIDTGIGEVLAYEKNGTIDVLKTFSSMKTISTSIGESLTSHLTYIHWILLIVCLVLFLFVYYIIRRKG